MQRLIKLIGITVSLVIANTTYAATEGSSTLTVDATIVPTLVMSLTVSSYNMGNLPIGVTEKAAAVGVFVQSNADYNIKVKADKSTMAEYGTTTGYIAGGRTLQYPVKSKTGANSYADITTSETIVPGCADINHTPNAGSTTNVDLSQEINYADETLPAANANGALSYRIILTFSVYQNPLE